VVISVALSFLTYVLARKRFALDEATSLSVAVNPTRMDNRQMAQFRVHNRGKRPVNIVSWGYGGPKGGSFSCLVHTFGLTCTNPTHKLPVLLKEQESCDFLVFVDEVPLGEINHFSVQDIQGHHYVATDQNVKTFIATAKRYQGV
jgi:hypothetical protein